MTTDITPTSPPTLPPWLATLPIQIGDRCASDGPRHKWLLSYDVRDPRRLARIHSCMKDWGKPVLYSVFECLLTAEEMERMWAAVALVIDAKADWVVLYRLHKPHDEAVRHVGIYDPDLVDRDDIVFI